MDQKDQKELLKEAQLEAIHEWQHENRRNFVKLIAYSFGLIVLVAILITVLLYALGGM